MLRYTLPVSTFAAFVFGAHGSSLASAQSLQQVQQREAQARAEWQRRAQGPAGQREIEERIARHQRDEQREAEESMARQRRARSIAEEQREGQEQAALLVQRRAKAEADRQRQLQQQEQGYGQPRDTRVESPEPGAQPELPARPEGVFSPALLAFVGSCLLAGVSLFMLGRIVRQRFMHP